MMTFLNETYVQYGILLCLWLDYIWELYLSIRQYKFAKRTTEVPADLKDVWKKETFEKARDYTLSKSQFGFIKDTYSMIVTTFIIYKGVLSSVWDYSLDISPYEGEVATSCVWLFILTTISTVMDLPLTIYYTFVLEEKYGFNKQTARFFVLDKLKAFVLVQVLTLSVSSLAIVIVKYGGDLFFVWLWLFICILVLILSTIYPSLIAPLFDKYTPLPEGELRTEIEKLASELKFPLAQLYVVEGSKRSTHSNAYLYGFLKKRIVLFDTLLANPNSGGCKNDEVLAVLSHELGHWKYNHIIKNMIIMQVNLLLQFSAFAYLFKFAPLYKAFGFYNTKPILVGLVIVLQYVMMPYNALIMFLSTCLSRKFEFEADAFANELGRSEPLIRALIQLTNDNLGFPVYDPLYSAWHHSHPPLLERIEALRKASKKLR